MEAISLVFYTFFLTWPLVYETPLVYLHNIYEFQGFRLRGAHYYTRFYLLSLCDYITAGAKERGFFYTGQLSRQRQDGP